MPASDYVLALRTKIGTDLLMLPSASVLVFDDDARVLLAKDKASHRWITVGGQVDPGESPADAAVRECWEETGTLVRLTALVGVFGGPDFAVTYENGDRTVYTNTTFLGKIISGTPEPDAEEISELAWISQNEFAGLDTSAATQTIVNAGFAYTGQPIYSKPTWQPPS